MSNQPTSMSSSNNERFVQTRSVREEASLKDLSDGFAADGDGTLEPQPVAFKVQDLRTFRAEYALKDQDLVVHFFLPSNVTEHTAHQYRDWWLQKFPLLLDQVAQSYFEEGPPRLSAKYTEEMASWWFKAQGYDHLLNPLGYLEKFLVALDDACAAA